MSTRGHKKPKDPNAPKKNMSSYFIYSNERRAPIQAEKKGTSVTEISKIISGEWKVMDISKKKDYEQKAAEQKAAYLLKFEAYKKTDNYTKHEKKLAEWKENEKALGRGRGKGGKRGNGPKKPKQPEEMPKRAQSSYFLFSNERRPQLKETYPEKKITELSKLIAAEWKLKTSEDKKTYEDKAEINKVKYHKDMTEYKQTEDYTKWMVILNEWKVEKKRWENAMDIDSDEIKVSLPRKPKDDKCPKRPLTSYFLYAKEVREETKAEFPTKAITEIAKEISKKWKVLTEEEKKPYNEGAARLKEQYKKDIAEYNGSESQKSFKQKLEEWKVECDKRRTNAKEKRDKKRELALKKKKKVSPKKKGGKKSTKHRKKMDTDSDDESSDSSASDSDSDSDSSSSGSSDSDSDSDSSSDDESSSD